MGLRCITALAASAAFALPPAGFAATNHTNLAVGFDQALAALNHDLEAKVFSISSRVRFENLGGCRVRHVNTWSEEAARRKGHAQAVTLNEFDLAADVASVEFVPTHDDYVGDRIEHWTDHIRINFRQPVMASLVTVEADTAVSTTAKFDSAFASIDALYANAYQVKVVVDQLNALVALCRASPGLKAEQTMSAAP